MENYIAEIISDPDEWDLHREDWNELLERSSFSNVFLTFEWLRVWWKFFKRGKLSIVLVKEDNKLVAALPFYIDKIGLIRVLKLIGTGESDYGGFIMDKAVSNDEFLKYIFRYIETQLKWDVIDFREIPEKSPLQSFLERNTRWLSILPYCRYELSDTCKCFYISYKRESSISEKVSDHHVKADNSILELNNYMHNKVDKSILSQLKRKERKLRKRGELSFEVIKTPDDALKNHFFITHIKRWKRDRVISKFSFYKYRRFHSEVINKFGCNGSLYFTALKLGDEYISYSYSFMYNKKIYYYICAYDLSFERFSPGNLLLKYNLEKMSNTDIEELDLLRGDEEYKRCWSELSRTNCRFVAARNNLNGILYKIFCDFFACLEKNKFTRKLCHFCLGVFKKLFLVIDSKNKI